MDSYDLKIYNGSQLQDHRREKSPYKRDEQVQSSEEDVVLSDRGHLPLQSLKTSSPVQNWKLHYNEKEVRNYKEFRADKQMVSRNVQPQTIG